MEIFSDKTIWAAPAMNRVIKLLENDFSVIYSKDPFSSELCRVAKDKKNLSSTFKSEYWPSLINAIDSKNAYIRTLTLDIMVQEEKAEIKKKLWNCFEDPYPMCRWVMVSQFTDSNRNRLYHELFQILLHDPVHWIRKDAAFRIKKDFADLLSFQFSEMSSLEQYRILDLLDLQTAADQKIAAQGIENDDEVAFKTAFYLKNSAIIEEWIEDNNHLDQLNKISRSPYMDLSSYLDLENIQDLMHAENALKWIINEERIDLLLEFIRYFIPAIEKAEDRENIVNILRPMLKKNNTVFSTECIGELMQALPVSDCEQFNLAELIKKDQFNTLQPYILSIIQEEEFVITDNWKKGLKKSLTPEFTNALHSLLIDSEWNNSFLDKVIILTMYMKQQDCQFILGSLFSRYEKESSWKLSELLSIAENEDKEKLWKVLNQLLVEDPTIAGLVIKNAPPEFIENQIGRLDEFFIPLNSEEKIQCLQYLWENTPDLSAEWMLRFADDPARDVKDYLENQILPQLEEQYPELYKEWII